MIPGIVALLLPNNNPTVSFCKGPQTPVGRAGIPTVGVRTLYMEELMSSPELPGFCSEKVLYRFFCGGNRLLDCPPP